jgi:glycosyltransferase involved in cell wall biosynthesis
MKIAMFSDAYWPRVNGVSVSIETYSRALIKLGHKVLIVCAEYPDTTDHKRILGVDEDDEKTDSGESLNPQLLHVPSVAFVLSKEDRIAHLHKIFWVTKQIGQFAPDIVHLNSEFMLANFGIYCALHYKLPIVYTFHTLWEEYAAQYLPSIPKPVAQALARRITKTVMHISNAIITPTTQVRDVVKRYKIKKETYLLPTGIDMRYLHTGEMQKEAFKRRIEKMYPILSGKKILLYAGRVTKEKNISFLLDILPAIIEKHKDALLVIVGDGLEREELENLCKERGLLDYCLFTGYFDRRDLGLMYHLANIFVFPSLTETQGLVTLEAMYSGIPVVAIGSMGTIMVMGGDNGGFMVKHDKAEFTSRVLQLLDNDELYKQKSEEAMQHSKSWMVDTLVLKLEEIYKLTIEKYKRNKKLHKIDYKQLAKIFKL